MLSKLESTELGTVTLAYVSKLLLLGTSELALELSNEGCEQVRK